MGRPGCKDSPAKDLETANSYLSQRLVFLKLVHVAQIELKQKQERATKLRILLMNTQKKEKQGCAKSQLQGQIPEKPAEAGEEVGEGW